MARRKLSYVEFEECVIAYLNKKLDGADSYKINFSKLRSDLGSVVGLDFDEGEYLFLINSLIAAGRMELVSVLLSGVGNLDIELGFLPAEC